MKNLQVKFKKNQLMFEVPKSLTVKVGKHRFIKEANGNLFWQNLSLGENVDDDEGWIYQTKKSKLDFAVIRDKTIHSTFCVTVEELEKLLKLAKQRKKFFANKKVRCFFLHLNPELSFCFKVK